MSTVELLLIALGLSMDCFAVALGVCSCKRQSWGTILKLSLFFGIFQGVMPVIGWVVGDSMQELIASVDHWIAFGLLSFIGGKMIWQSFNHLPKKTIHFITLPVLITLSVATSIDALITGIGFGFMEVNILKAGVIIFLVTFFMTLIGAKMGEKATFLSACWAERLGGVVLILIGVKILIDHIWGWPV